MKNRKKTNYSDYSELILTALMIAMIFISGNFIKIPTIGGFIHTGDCMVLLSSVLLGKKRGAIASSIGMTLIDIYSGYLIWAPFTFLIKGSMAYLTGYLLNKFHNTSFKTCFLSFTASGIFMIISYFLAGSLIARFFIANCTSILGAFAYSLKDVMGNVIQVSIGIIIALSLTNILLRIKILKL